MGLYDRDYGRDERSPWDRVENPRNITITLVVINVVIYFVDVIVGTKEVDPLSGQIVKSYPINEWLAVHDTTLLQPWMWWQFLTYGFVHSIQDIFHLVFNMFVLYVFGRNVERRMGRMEYLRFYLLALIVGGIVGSATLMVSGGERTIGASGAVMGVVVLFACYFPNQEILLMFVFPMKAWVLAVVIVMLDMLGAIGIFDGTGASNTAFTVHLAGAFFALGYYFLHWNLRWLDLAAFGELPQRLRQRSRRMKLKLHDPDKKLEREAEEADRILAKIHAQGESSLTSAERKTLERYSRRQREKKRDQ